jgi:hypothetical protein
VRAKQTTATARVDRVVVVVVVDRVVVVEWRRARRPSTIDLDIVTNAIHSANEHTV